MNIKFLIPGLLFILLLSSAETYAQSNKRPGDWTTYLSQRSSIRSVVRSGVIYNITTGGMFSYNTSTGETQTFSTVDGMSSINPTTIYFAEERDLIFIGYDDGRIDFLDSEGRFRVFTDISRNNFFTQKRINSFASQGQFLYIATQFGMVVYDLDRLLPDATVTQIDTNPSRLPLVSVTTFENRIWVVTDEFDLYSADVNVPNISDPTVWRKESGRQGLSDEIRVFEAGSSSLGLFIRTSEAIFELENNEWSALAQFNQFFDGMEIQDEGVCAVRISTARILRDDGSFLNVFIQGGAVHALISDADIYISDKFFGLQQYRDRELSAIAPAGPRNNFVTRVAAGNGELYIAPLGYDEIFAPTVDASGVYYFQQDSGWKNINIFTNTLPEDRANTGYARAYYNPQSKTAWMGSWGLGVGRFEQGDFKEFYDCANAGLSTITGNCDPTFQNEVRVSGIGEDNFGNLWVTIQFALQPLMVFTPDSQWVGLSQSRFPNGFNAIDMIIDNYNNKWIVDRKRGMIVVNDNNTPDDPSDDNVRGIRAGAGNGNLPTNEVFSVVKAKDREGSIWVGTSEGVAVFFDPFSIGQGSIIDASRPIFNGRFLLENEEVFSIAVDGGNRKWCGTANGAFLLSEDGTEQIFHFTTKNSPLLSDRINQIAIDDQTGEVYFATDKGLISFKGDATIGAEDCDGLYVYPNPVLSDFDGNITIQGIQGSNSDVTVRIVNTAGILVKELTARGGTATWNGVDNRGDKVRSGVYLALSADEDGENACITKFVILGR